jgi:hypothetical protein
VAYQQKPWSHMMAKRTPPPRSQPQPSLPHDSDRESGQPYAKEVDDYKQGVAAPPKEQGEQKTDRPTKRTAPSPE